MGTPEIDVEDRKVMRQELPTFPKLAEELFNWWTPASSKCIEGDFEDSPAPAGDVPDRLVRCVGSTRQEFVFQRLLAELPRSGADTVETRERLQRLVSTFNIKRPA